MLPNDALKNKILKMIKNEILKNAFTALNEAITFCQSANEEAKHFTKEHQIILGMHFLIGAQISGNKSTHLPPLTRHIDDVKYCIDRITKNTEGPTTENYNNEKKFERLAHSLAYLKNSLNAAQETYQELLQLSKGFNTEKPSQNMITSTKLVEILLNNTAPKPLSGTKHRMMSPPPAPIVENKKQRVIPKAPPFYKAAFQLDESDYDPFNNYKETSSSSSYSFSRKH